MQSSSDRGLTSLRQLARLIAICFLLFGGPVNAQIPDNATNDELKKLKEDADARRAAYEALKQADDAKRAFETGQDAAKQALADQSAAAKAAKDVADAQTAAANAQKAQVEAELAAVKAKIGEIPPSGYSGAVDLGTNAGNAEATLLGAAAVNQVAMKFAERIKADRASRSVLLLSTPGTLPDFQLLMTFNAQLDAVRAAVIAARESTKKQVEDVSKAGVQLESIAALGLGLDAVNKLLAFAKGDYKFIGIDVASNDAMLLSALAQQLKAGGAVSVEIPAVYFPDAFAASNAVLKKITDIYQWSTEAKRHARTFEAAQTAIEKQLAGKADDEELKNRLAEAKRALGTWKSVSDTIDGWVKQITVADDKGNVVLASILRQSALKQKLDGGAALLVVQLHKVAGTGYTKKSFVSSLFGINPFFVMGGAVAGYVALDGKSGQAFSSMLLPMHGGYHSVSDVQDIVGNASH